MFPLTLRPRYPNPVWIHPRTRQSRSFTAARQKSHSQRGRGYSLGSTNVGRRHRERQTRKRPTNKRKKRHGVHGHESRSRHGIPRRKTKEKEEDRVCGLVGLDSSTFAEHKPHMCMPLLRRLQGLVASLNSSTRCVASAVTKTKPCTTNESSGTAYCACAILRVFARTVVRIAVCLLFLLL